MSKKIERLLEEVYGGERGQGLSEKVRTLMDSYRNRISQAADHTPASLALDQKDAVMIAYGDQFKGPDARPMEYLRRFLAEQCGEWLAGVHILPFFPYSSDDGFSIIDYRKVNPEMGSWEDISAIASKVRLMVDLVLNHCSVAGPWFKAFLEWKEPYKHYFITVPPGTDVSEVARPRAHPLLTPFETADGEKLVWTTFSTDQADLDFDCEEVLLEMIDILLGYIEAGAEIIRLDAIAYLWKELGTPCIHHPNTHRIVKLFRSILEEVAPQVVIITETNVPHEENMSYFGDGTDEAHMIYQFSLPPLVLDAFLRSDTGYLQGWAQGLPESSGQTTYFNFLASHDGVGLLPAKGILSDDELSGLIESIRERGGRISYKSTAKGDIPYEMNINYLDAVAKKMLATTERAAKFLASQSIMLVMAGVPGIYVHSLIGSENYLEGLEKTGINRSINRAKLDYRDLISELEDEGSLRNLVFKGFKDLLSVRRREAAFHPMAAQKVLSSPREIFAVLRTPRSEVRAEGRIICLTNVSAGRQSLRFGEADLEGNLSSAHEVITGNMKGRVTLSNNGECLEIDLEPYEVKWIKLN